MLSKFVKDPILHFLVAGLALYILASVMSGPEAQPAEEKQIIVGRDSLLTYMQYQSNAFDSATFAAALDGMDEQRLQQLIDAYVSEEVLYREAAALGLEHIDYIIRQRMVDKMRFLLSDLSAEEATPDDAALQAWLNDNLTLYRIQPSATFTHVFVDSSNSDKTQAQERANALLQQLNANKTGFNDAAELGDRFPFLRNYVERTIGFAAGHFGNDFAQALQQLIPSETQWQGPLQSAYGYHLVLLTALIPPRDPSLEEVRTDVARDYNASKAEERLSQMVEAVRAQYQISVGDIQESAALPGGTPQAGAQVNGTEQSPAPQPAASE